MFLVHRYRKHYYWQNALVYRSVEMFLLNDKKKIHR